MLVFCIINADHGVPRSEGLYIRPHLPLPSNKNLSEVGRGGAIGKTRGSESDDRLPLVLHRFESGRSHLCKNLKI